MKKVTDYFKKAPGKYFLVLFLWTMWLYNANVLAHILSIELNGGLQAAATFVFIVFTYYIGRVSINILKLKS